MQRLRLLIVDDEADLVSTLAERLTLRGFEVEGATSGADALGRVAKAEFSLLLLDVKMPGIAGVDLMHEIKQQHPDLPVILFTGHASVADAERGMREGAFDYLVKPIDIDRLVEKINNAAAGREGQTP